MPIFVDTDNTNPNDKLYTAKTAGQSAGAVEDAIQKMVKRIIENTSGFTTAKGEKPKGYTIKLTVTKVERANGETKCGLSGTIVRYPKTVNHRGEEGEVWVGLSMKGSAKVGGTDEGALLDCVKALTKDMVEKDAVKAMKEDWPKW